MELTKKKYKRSEVEVIVNELIADYENKLNEQKSRILDLSEENRGLSAELFECKKNEGLIAESLKKAEKSVQNTKKRADSKYDLEVMSLENFSRKWKAYFTYLKDTYPLYPATKDANLVYEKINKILAENISIDAVKKIDKAIPKTLANNVEERFFNPQAKINEYIAATSDNGFNLDEVLNPGELQLEDLCKELGLMDEKI